MTKQETAMETIERLSDEELQLRANELRSEIRARRESADRKEREKTMGRVYRMKNNYSLPQGPSDYWDFLARVVADDELGARMQTVQIDKNGKVEAELSGFYKTWLQEEVTTDDWNAKIDSCIAVLESMRA